MHIAHNMLWLLSAMRGHYIYVLAILSLLPFVVDDDDGDGDGGAIVVASVCFRLVPN